MAISMAGRLVLASTLLTGCVTAQPATTTETAARTDANDGATTTDGGSYGVDTEGGEAYSGNVSDEAPDAIDWQRVLMADVDAIEARGNAFLDVSFALYDHLLGQDEADGAAAKAPKPDVAAAVKASADHYAKLVEAVDRLKADLDRAEVRAALPLKGDSGEQEFASIAELFRLYSFKPEASTVTYDMAAGSSIVKVLFASEDLERDQLLTELPKAQRDALLLLDQLRRISSDLAFVSGTVTAWVHDQPGIDIDEAFVH